MRLMLWHLGGLISSFAITVFSRNRYPRNYVIFGAVSVHTKATATIDYQAFVAELDTKVLIYNIDEVIDDVEGKKHGK